MIRCFEELKENCSILDISFIETNILIEFIKPFKDNSEVYPDIIIDTMLQASYKDIFKSFEKFRILHSKAYMNNGYYVKTLTLDRNGIDVSFRELKQVINADIKAINKAYTEFSRSYDLFKDDLFERKIYLETKYKI
ncbi:hypothetical protein LEP1GSC188_3165 [Leptospira weilii serovar Topaz str. LT2116]|uniref:Uncharacterized protein n=1 Tax=Leptospira weilii serovar Topaz str. LT2116 TaxID=1088540 RepID=M3EIJ5_9LEPT|nr:hypothetical protein LEP1GSC188_3165 [Leptospira weilii serovar Topaz str. LT2116]